MPGPPWLGPRLPALVVAAACVGAMTAVLLHRAGDDAMSLRVRITTAFREPRQGGRA